MAYRHRQKNFQRHFYNGADTCNNSGGNDDGGDCKRKKLRFAPFSSCCCRSLLSILFIVAIILLVVFLNTNRNTATVVSGTVETTQTYAIFLGNDHMLNPGDVVQIFTNVTNKSPVPLTNSELQDSVFLGTICMPLSVNSSIGTLLVGEMATCIGNYIIKRSDIDAGMWMVNSTFLSSEEIVFFPKITVNLTQTTFGNLSVSQEHELDLGSDGILNAGDIIVVNVKVVNTGTETINDLVSNTYGMVVPILEPMNMTTFSYNYTIQIADTISMMYTLNETVIGIGTTSGKPVSANNVQEVNLTGAVFGSIELSQSFMTSGVCAHVGQVVMITFTVENTGTSTVENVVLDDTLVGTNVLCTPMYMDGTIGTMFPGDIQTCTGSYMLQAEDIELGFNTRLSSTATVFSSTIPNVVEHYNYTIQGKTITHIDMRTTSVNPRGLFSTVDLVYTPPVYPAIVEYFIPSTPGLECWYIYSTVRLFSTAGVPAVWSWNNIMTHPQHLFFHLGFDAVPLSMGTLVITTTPPGLQEQWFTRAGITNTGNYAWDAISGTITMTGENGASNTIVLEIYNLANITDITITAPVWNGGVTTGGVEVIYTIDP